MKKGFTLIELLIVIAIIAILAAIAVPNFLEAQTRAKVARVKSDQRSLATGLEAYYVDNNNYPAWVCAGSDSQICADDQNWERNGLGHANAYAGDGSGQSPGVTRMHSFRIRTELPWDDNENLFFMMTTPISYVTSFFVDPFADTRGACYGYYAQKTGFIVYSFGPDVDENEDTTLVGDIDPNVQKETVYNHHVAQPTITLITLYGAHPDVGGYGQGAFTYDPTNGTGSEGDVYRVKQ
jgi:prepilin-type N-terminal cleavage/methylation domain-containing protein